MPDSPAAVLSVIIPAYNESRRLPPYLQAIRDYLRLHYQAQYEVIVVDDGSSDHLLETLTTACGDWPQLKVLRHTQNIGKGAAVRTGVQAAGGDRILFADADGATPIEEESKLARALAEGAALAVGSRLMADRHAVRQRTWQRAVVGRTFAALARRMFALSVLDTQCGFKMFHREPAQRLFALSQENGYLFDIEILALAQRLGYRTVEVPINWADRPGSRLSLWRDGRSIWAGLRRLRDRLTTLHLDYD